jgi:hypothetical protein
MTWRTPLGERVLNSAEAVLLRAVIDSVRDELREEALGNEQWTYGVRAFDDLTLPQRLWMLCEVSEALFRSETSSPELTAINEGTVAVIFKALQQQLTFELELLAPEPGEMPSEFAGYWRRLVRAAALSTLTEENHSFDPAEIPDVECDDIEDWHGVVEVLSERVLWDTDYDDEDLYSDHPPEIAESVKRTSGIPDGYFTAIAHEPRDDEVEGLFERLRSPVN